MGAVVRRLGVELRLVLGAVLRLGMVFEVVLTVIAVLRAGVVFSGACCRGMITGRVEDNCEAEDNRACSRCGLILSKFRTTF